jgi:hypothetical protein
MKFREDPRFGKSADRTFRASPVFVITRQAASTTNARGEDMRELQSMRHPPAWPVWMLFAVVVAVGCRGVHRTAAAAPASSTILAKLPVDSALRVSYGAGTGLAPSVSAGVGSVPPERVFEALYTVEFHAPQADDSVVQWLGQVMCQLLRQRGARITTYTQYDPTLRSFHFETPTTQGWVNVSARKRRGDGSEPYAALAFEVPRAAGAVGSSLDCGALSVQALRATTGGDHGGP